MLGRSIANQAPVLAAQRPFERRCAVSTSIPKRNRAKIALCHAKEGEADLQLVRKEETSDGAILFVFGDEAEAAAAHQSTDSSPAAEEPAPAEPEPSQEASEPEAAYEAAREEAVKEAASATGAVESPQQAEETEASNGAILPGFDEDEEMDPDEMLSDEDAPDLQDEIAKTLTSLRVADLKAMCKDRKITGYSKLRKSGLVRILKEAMLADA